MTADLDKLDGLAAAATPGLREASVPGPRAQWDSSGDEVRSYAASPEPTPGLREALKPLHDFVFASTTITAADRHRILLFLDELAASPAPELEDTRRAAYREHWEARNREHDAEGNHIANHPAPEPLETAPAGQDREGLRAETAFVQHPAIMALNRKDRTAVVAAFQEALSSEAASPAGWDEALADPAFKASLDEGLADVAAGRVSPSEAASPAGAYVGPCAVCGAETAGHLPTCNIAEAAAPDDREGSGG